MKRILIISLAFLSVSISSCRFIVEPDMYVGTYTGTGTIGGNDCDTLSTTLTLVEAGSKKVDIHYSTTNGYQYNFYGLNVERSGSIGELIDFSSGGAYPQFYCYIYRNVSGPSLNIRFEDSVGYEIRFSGDRY